MSQKHARLIAAASVIAALVLALAAIVPAANAATRSGHRCVQGDPPLLASIQTSCAFAGNIITAYVVVCHEARKCRMHVYDPTLGKRYSITCRRRGTIITGTVKCWGPSGTGIWTRFPALI